MATVNKRKNLSAGVSKASKRVGPVDPKGAYTKVQKRTLGNMKKGGKAPKAFLGMLATGLAGNMMQRKLKKKIMKEGPQIASMIGTGGAGAAAGGLGGMLGGLGGARKGKKVKKAQDGYRERYKSPVGKPKKTMRNDILTKRDELNRKSASGVKPPVLQDSDLRRKLSLKGTPSMKKGGAVDKKWIQKAINPKHKGYCTPMTKKTCTPKRKALAMTLKKMAKSRKGK